MPAKWKDTTSYCRDQDDRTPREWRIKIGFLSVVLHRHIHHPPNQWLLTVHGAIEEQPLEEKDVDAAKSEAMEIVAHLLKTAISELPCPPPKNAAK